MSGFSEAVLDKKLAELNNSQQSIQTLSLWLIHHRKHHAAIVKIWHKEFLKSIVYFLFKRNFSILQLIFPISAKDSRKLTFIFLVNDVIQNCRKKGPEFRTEFSNILGSALKSMGSALNDEKTRKSLDRILNIWGERNLFESKVISEFRKILGKLSRSPSKT